MPRPASAASRTMPACVLESRGVTETGSDTPAQMPGNLAASRPDAKSGVFRQIARRLWPSMPGDVIGRSEQARFDRREAEADFRLVYRRLNAQAEIEAFFAWLDETVGENDIRHEPWVSRHERRRDGTEPADSEGDRACNSKRARQVVLRCSNRPIGAFQIGKDGRHAFEVGLAVLRQFDVASGAGEESRAQFGFQRRDLAAGSRFRYAQLRGGACEAAFFGDQDEGFESRDPIHSAPITPITILLLRNMQQ